MAFKATHKMDKVGDSIWKSLHTTCTHKEEQINVFVLNLLHFLSYRSMPSCVLLQYSSPTCVWGQGYCNRTYPY